MLTLQIPMLLALLGTALMAVVIFAPSRVPARSGFAAAGAISFAPPPAPPAVERWDPPADPMLSPADAWPATAPEPAWPTLVDYRAAGCDAYARCALVDALATIGTPWADAILRRALDDEPDALVRAAITAVLGA
jgi:hypothetical protein